MKIAILSCVFPPYRGGIGEVAYNFAASLSAYDHQVTVLTPDYGKEEGELSVNSLFKIVKLKPWIKFGKAAFMPGLLKEINKYDIVQLHYPFFGASELIWLSSFFKKKYKLFVHYHMDTGNLPLSKRVFSLPSVLIRNSLFLRADKITCASLDYIKNSRVKKIYEKYPFKFKEIPFGVDTDKFIPDAASKNPDKYKIIFVGGLDKAHYYKGVGMLLEIISRINKDYELIIVGDGELKKFYKNKTNELGISDKVDFVGGISDEQKINNLQAADLLVLPSINSHEAFGLVLIEAMACGTAVLASDLPGVRRVFKDREHGFLFRTKDKTDLLKKLNLALDNKDRLVNMGRKGRQYVEEKYSLKAMGKKLNFLFSNTKRELKT